MRHVGVAWAARRQGFPRRAWVAMINPVWALCHPVFGPPGLIGGNYHFRGSIGSDSRAKMNPREHEAVWGVDGM